MIKLFFNKYVLGVVLGLVYLRQLTPYVINFDLEKNIGWLLVYLTVVVVIFSFGTWLLSLLMKLLLGGDTRDVPPQVEHDVYAHGPKRSIQVASLFMCFIILVAMFISLASDMRTTPLVLLVSAMIFFFFFVAIVHLVGKKTGQRTLAEPPRIAHEKSNLKKFLK